MNFRSIAVYTCVLLAAGSWSCSKSAPSSEKPSELTSQTSVHAPKDVKPSSYEDWCEEHAVPESQCTRCDPALIPAFKATGDWCAEHGVPESQCLKCNPELKIVRPPKGS